jgi:hypothetical protein
MDRRRDGKAFEEHRMALLRAIPLLQTEVVSSLGRWRRFSSNSINSRARIGLAM